MIHVVTGLNPAGQSAVISREDKVPRPRVDQTSGEQVAGQRTVVLHSTEGPDARSDSTPLGGSFLDLRVHPGGSRWVQSEFDADIVEFPLHHTGTLDYGFILRGEVELLLEVENVLLRAGDSVVIPGVPHGWRSSTGWSYLVCLIALDTPGQRTVGD